MIKITSIILAFFFIIPAAASGALEGHYLQWNSDHTARDIKPEYPIGISQLGKFSYYSLSKDKDGRVRSVKFFVFGKASNGSNFGAHEIRFVYSNGVIERHYYGLDGSPAANSLGVYQERYVLSNNGYYSAITYHNQSGNRIENKYGIAEEIIKKRDDLGRRKSILFRNLKGELVVDNFNGFLVTSFSYDHKNHVTERRALDANGSKVLGRQGYHQVRFLFDVRGNRTMESFHDLEGNLMVPEGDTFAKIEIDYEEGVGRPIEVRYFGQNDRLREKLPAISQLKRSHNVPLSKPVMDILHSLPRVDDCDFVFTTTGRSPISGFGKYKKRLEAAIGADNWRIHDLRRTAATGMAKCKVQPHVVEKVLNHASGIISGVSAVYNRFGYEDEKREALDLWADYIKGLANEQ